MNEYYLYSAGAHYGSSPLFFSGDSLPKEGFASLYAVSRETAEAIQQEGTTRSFKGVVFSPFLWLDFDRSEDAEAAGSRLEEMGLEFDAYTTGNRGLHFRLVRGAVSYPSHLLPARDKQWIREFFPRADASIYTHLHPFRLEGTRHEKTGLIKERVYHFSGAKIDVPPLSEEAFTPNTHEGQRRSGSIFDSLKLMSNTVPAENGQRQYYLIRQLYALKEHGMSADFALTWISEWNKMLLEPKEDSELEKALRSIYR